MADDLVVPQIHIQRQLIIYALHIESRHVADDALKRPVDSQFCHKQIREYTARIARLFVPVMLCPAFDPGNFAAFMGIRWGKHEAGIQTYLGIEPPIAVGWVLHVVFPKKHNIVDQSLCPFGWI